MTWGRLLLSLSRLLPVFTDLSFTTIPVSTGQNQHHHKGSGSMTLKEDFQILKSQIQMRIYNLQGEISERQKFIESLKAQLRIIEAEEILLLKQGKKAKA
jgi:TolA-binding protein